MFKQIVGPVEHGCIVKGTIFSCDTIPLSGCTVTIQSTNLGSARTDSSGRFTLYNMPSGTFILSISGTNQSLAFDTIIGISTAGEESVEVTIILPEPINYYFKFLKAIDTHDTVYEEPLKYVSGSVAVIQNNSVITSADTVRIDVSLYKDNIPAEVPVVIIQKSSGDTLYDSIPVKGRIASSFFTFNKAETLYCIISGSTVLKIIVEHSNAAPDRISSLYITTGQPQVFTNKSGAQYAIYNQQKAVIGTDTLMVYFTPEEVCDFDLYLMNESGDTCFWRNPAPLWISPGYSEGSIRTGSILFTGADPSAISVTFNYPKDVINGKVMSGGKYTVFLKYFDGPQDSVSATPSISIFAGTNQSGVILNCFNVSSPAPLHKGEYWRAGTISFPDCSFDTTGQRIYK